MTLGAARDELAATKALLRQYKDSVQQRLVRRAEGIATSERTFSVVAAEWLAMKKSEWSATHYETNIR